MHFWSPFSAFLFYHKQFYGCSSLTSLDLSSFDTSKVTNMNNMFYNCSSLTSLDLSSFDTSMVTDMGAMFNGCSSLTSLDLSSFDTRNVTNMSEMFMYNTKLKTILVSDKWNTGKVELSEAMFAYCDKLVGGNGTVYDEGIVGATYARTDKAGDSGYLTENTLYNVAFKHNCSFQNDLSMYYA
ncbi:MAG: BspA family leucine-rich repeat surface protein, partial [Oscillospiraceae bacterium]|nr:BspA family leucine-rich repeat surface protein [Oscillospiraceae bacterium]